MGYPIVILGSGRGTNAEALLKAESKKQLGSAKIAAIVSDHDDAGILTLGQKYKVPTIYIDPGQKGAHLSKKAEQTYIERITSFSPKLVVLAGFMRILRAAFIDAFEGNVINLHPSLLPSFPGMHGIRQAYEHGVKITGCTVHWVTPELDAGPHREYQFHLRNSVGARLQQPATGQRLGVREARRGAHRPRRVHAAGERDRRVDDHVR